MLRPLPAREKLLEFARYFARELHGVQAPERALTERIEYVLWGRKQGWARLEANEMSEEELRDLLIAHFDYECADLSGKQWSELDEDLRAEAVRRLDAILFQPSASKPEA